MYLLLWTEQKTVQIAVASSFSGKYKDYGNEMLRGINLYIDQINSKGGINGTKIKLLVFDDKGTGNGAVKSAKDIVKNNKILLVLGHYLSTSCLYAAPIYEKNKMPSITASATLDELTTRNEWLFRIVPPNVCQTKFLSVYAKTALGVNKASIIYDTDAYGSNLSKSFIEKASEICIDIVQKYPVSVQKTDIDNQIEQIVKSLRNKNDIDMIFLATHAKLSAKLLVQLRKNKCNQIILGSDAMASSFFLENLKTYSKEQSSPDIYSNDIYSITWYSPNLSGKTNIDFTKAYTNKYNFQPSLISASAYELAHVAISALKSVDLNTFSRTTRKNNPLFISDFNPAKNPALNIKNNRKLFASCSKKGRAEIEKYSCRSSRKTEQTPPNLVVNKKALIQIHLK